jgi:hypothetical protein
MASTIISAPRKLEVGVDKPNWSDLRLGVYLRNVPPKLIYEFVVGDKAGFDKITLRLNFVSLKPVPMMWREDLQEYLSKAVEKTGGWINRSMAEVGYITYVRQDYQGTNVAICYHYYPRNHLGRHFARRFPYFMEAISTNHMKYCGSTHVFASSLVSVKRERQLGDVELSTTRNVAIDEWLKGMGRGIKMAKEGSFSDV